MQIKPLFTQVFIPELSKFVLQYLLVQLVHSRSLGALQLTLMQRPTTAEWSSSPGPTGDMDDIATARNGNLEKKPKSGSLHLQGEPDYFCMTKSAPRMKLPDVKLPGGSCVFMGGYHVSLKFQSLQSLALERLLSRRVSESYH